MRRPCSPSDSPRSGRARTSTTSRWTCGLVIRSHAPSRAISRRRRSLPANTRPLTNVFASTNSFTIPLLPGFLLHFVKDLFQSRAGEAGLLHLSRNRVEEFFVFPQPPDYRGPSDERHFHVVALLESKGLADLLG